MSNTAQGMIIDGTPLLSNGSPKYLIYALKDPVSQEIRYIGKSSSGLRRARSHYHNNKTNNTCSKKNNWIKHLKSIGLKPDIEVLCILLDPKYLSQMEIHYIAKHRHLGCNLVNQTDGGEGLLGRPHSFNTRMKMSHSRNGYDDEIQKQVCEMYREGCSTKKIKDILGVPRNSAWKILNRHGVPLRGRHESRVKDHYEKNVRIFDMVNSGVSIEDVCKNTGLKPKSIQKILKRMKGCLC